MSSAPVPKGLVNLGNTCYFNSIMQVLMNAPLFGPLLEERTSPLDNKYTLEDSSSKQKIELELPDCDLAVKNLVELYRSYTSNPTAISPALVPTKVIHCIRSKTGRFQRLVQEDSHELLRSLIDIVRSDEIRRQKAAIASYVGETKSNEIKADYFTIIDMVFGGYFLSSVTCQKCKYKSEHLEPFYDMSLAITNPIKNIHDAIDDFTSIAILDGDNKFICERCSKVNRKKTYEAGIKSTTIAVPPNILTLHLKRFEASGGIEIRGLGGGRRGKKNSGGGGRRNRGKGKGGDDDDDKFISRGGVNFRKIDKHVEFSEFLDISEFTSDLCYDLTKINRWPRIKRGDPIQYSLFGVVCHSGSLRSGHYTAYVKSENTMHPKHCLDEYADFIQNTPYLPELADIERIRESIRQYDATHCETTDRYRYDDQDSNGPSENDDKQSIPGNWYDISDSSVRKTTLYNVLSSSEAYILFYRRVINLENYV